MCILLERGLLTPMNLLKGDFFAQCEARENAFVQCNWTEIHEGKT